MRNMILDQSIRLDGRVLDQVRPLSMEADFLPSPHGSALFTRGETQSLTTVTLGTPDDELLIESAAAEEKGASIRADELRALAAELELLSALIEPGQPSTEAK